MCLIIQNQCKFQIVEYHRYPLFQNDYLGALFDLMLYINLIHSLLSHNINIVRAVQNNLHIL